MKKQFLILINMKKTILIFFLISLKLICKCELKILKGEIEKILVKNRYIELEIIPEYGGVISKYELNKNTIIFPFRIIKEEIYPGSPIKFEIPNYAGISDWLWPGGGNFKKEIYDYEIVENSSEKVIINLKNINGIERKISVYKDKSFIEISVKKLIEKGSYWFHSIFCIGGDYDEEDLLIIPLTRIKERIRNITEIIDKEEIKVFHPSEGSYFYVPGQNWFCIIDRNKKLTGGIVIEKDMTDKKVIFYSWNGKVEKEKKGISLEVIYPEGENEFKIYLISISGLKDISYLSENITLNFKTKEKVKKNEKIPYFVEISSPQKIKKLKMKFGIGKNFKEVFIDELNPLKIYRMKGEINGLENKGFYKWNFKVIKDNEIIEDFYLLKETEVI